MRPEIVVQSSLLVPKSSARYWQELYFVNKSPLRIVLRMASQSHSIFRERTFCPSKGSPFESTSVQSIKNIDCPLRSISRTISR